MEDLAVLAVILFMLAIFPGPISILIAKLKTDSLLLLILKRVFQSLFIFVGSLAGGFILMIRSLPIGLRLIGVISICLCYIGLRNEYFPSFKVLQRLGIKRRNKSAHGPAMKWKFGGRNNGKDGHGPEGQH